MNVLLTGGGSGGHVSPALAVAQLLRQEYPGVNLLYVGGTMTMEGSSGPSIEQQLVEPTGVPFVAIHSGKLPRDRVGLNTVRRAWGAVPGFFEAWRVVYRFKPDVVFSSGGYVSLPVVIAAWLQRVPIVIHEQTTAVGLANGIAGKLATKVAVTFPQSIAYFKKSKVVVAGNPLRSEILQPDEAALSSTKMGRWVAAAGLPLVYVTGGGLGSHVMNVAVEGALPQLLERYRMVHQTGSHTTFADYDRLLSVAGQLPKEIRERYWPQQQLTPAEVGLVYHHASLVVARAGANTVLELAAVGLPAIFIPIPWVTHDEQTKNAHILVEAGTARILPEAELTPERLVNEINQLMAHVPELDEARTKAKALVDGKATERLAKLIREVAGG